MSYWMYEQGSRQLMSYQVSEPYQKSQDLNAIAQRSSPLQLVRAPVFGPMAMVSDQTTSESMFLGSSYHDFDSVDLLVLN